MAVLRRALPPAAAEEGRLPGRNCPIGKKFSTSVFNVHHSLQTICLSTVSLSLSQFLCHYICLLFILSLSLPIRLFVCMDSKGTLYEVYKFSLSHSLTYLGLSP